MQLTVLGSSAGCPVPGNPASGYLVAHDGTVIWCDAGPGTFMALMDRVGPADVDAIVISHVHTDHCADLVAFFGYMAHGPGGDVHVPVYLPQGTVEPIAAFVRAERDHALYSILDFRVVAEGDVAIVGPVTIEFGETHHPVPTVASRFLAGGRSLAYSADTGPGGGFPALAHRSDVVLCEATGVGDRRPWSYEYHLTAGEAGSLARAARAELIVTHLSSTVDVSRVLSEAEATYGRVPQLAVPGLEVPI